MKKLLTLVLALVLVFAIAAPALAITGDIVGEKPVTKVDFIDVDVELFNTAFSTDFGFQLSSIASNKAYVVNEVAFWGVVVSFQEPDATENEKFNMAKSDRDDIHLVISSDALSFAGAPALKVYDNKNDAEATVSGQVFTYANKKYDADLELGYFLDEDNLDGDSFNLFVFGQGIVKGKGVVKAELKDVNELSATTPITIYNGTTKLYVVNKISDGYYVDVYKAADPDNWVGQVRFVVVDDEVVKIQVSHADQWKDIGYNVKGDTTSEIIPQAIGGVDITTSTSLTTAWNYYEQVMKFFGFNYTAEGLLQDKHFEAKATGLYMKDEVAVQLYTGSIVIPSEVEVPKTGDAASIVGFVMIAVAMIAAGVVVSRKVRA